MSQPYKAAAYMTGAVVSFSTMAVAGRELTGVLDTFEIMAYRSVVGLIIVLAIGGAMGRLVEIKTNRLGLHAIRNIFHFAGQNLWFFAVGLVPLSQLFAFEFSTPLWVALFAPFVLGEKMTLTRLMAAGLGFVGILIVARPDAMVLGPGIIAAALCAIGFAGAVLTTKLLSKDQTVTCILFWLVAMQAVFGFICAGFDGQMALPTGTALLWVTLVGICGLLAHFCITTALKLAPATVVSPLEFIRLPLISVIGLMLYNEPLAWSVLFGATIVFAANLINLRAEQKRA